MQLSMRAGGLRGALCRIVGAAALVASCGPGAMAGDAGSESSVEAGGGETRTVRFQAVVGTRPFACGQTFTGVGMGGTGSWTPQDFRLYVSNVRLVNAAGAEVAFELDEGPFQRAGVALLDFEDGSGACRGTAETHTELTGRAPAGVYTGVRFTVGVPFALNHADAASAPAPLNDSSLWWSWNGGYRFARIDGTTTGVPMGFQVHIGSTGCAGNSAGAVNACRAPNRAEVSLTGFDPSSGAVRVDLAALLSETNVDTNAMGTPPGCMSEATDGDCAGIFAALGLGFGSAPANPAGQRFFRAP